MKILSTGSIHFQSSFASYSQISTSLITTASTLTGELNVGTTVHVCLTLYSLIFQCPFFGKPELLIENWNIIADHAITEMLRVNESTELRYTLYKK